MTALLAHSYSCPPCPGRTSPCTPFLATSWDLVLFLCAGGLTFIFTVLFLVDDDSNDNKVLGKQQSHCQLPMAVCRDGPCVRGSGALFLIYHGSLSHLVVR